MQVSRFTNGGFVLHRVEGRFSCWYDANGDMLECEATHNRAGRIMSTRTWPIKRESATWQRLAKLGAVYKQ